MVFVPSTLRRWLAVWIDRMILIFLCFPLWIQLIVNFFRFHTWMVSWKWVGICFVLQFLYRYLFLFYLGGTFGKLLLGLRVVSSQDPEAPLKKFQCFLRVFMEHFSLFFGNALYSTAFFRYDRTHLVDWVCETRVIQRQLRLWPTRRRWILGSFLVIYVSLSSWMQIYRGINHIEFSRSGIRWISAD